MRHKLQQILTSLILFFTTICLFSQEQTNKLSFLQDDIQTQLNKKTETVFLKRKLFSVRFMNEKYDEETSQFHSMKVAILSNPKDTLILATEKEIDLIPFFAPGSGMAPGVNNMYDTIFITNNGSHYIIYDGEDDNRAYLISKENQTLELEWKILAANYKDKFFQLDKLKLSTLYFVLLIDKNLNDIIDENELNIVIVTFI
jgi:hypothetical protein